MQNPHPVRLLRILLAVSMSTLICNVAAQESLSSFEQALKATGWSVQREVDGSLILEPRQSLESIQGNNISTEDQWSQLQNELQAAGWFVEREADGSLILVPPRTAASEKQKAIGQETEIINAGPSPAMQQQLRDTGWRITNTPDGSILLYPPGASVASPPRPCPGTSLKAEISLPVDSGHEAYIIARGWLKNHPPFHAAVGRIRKILNVYVVSIVSDQAPYPLIQQIAIRNSDGAVIVLN